MLQFADSLWLILILILPSILWISSFIAYSISKKHMIRSLGVKIYTHLTASLSLPRRFTKTLLMGGALILFLLAMARPQWGDRKEEIISQGIEIIVLADVSESMLSDDVRPSRLEALKLEMEKLVDLFPGDRLGLVAFAGSSTLLCPLTTDPGSVKLYLESLSPLSVSTQGTNFKKALEVAQGAFIRGGVNSHSEAEQVTRAIIIASDGEDHEPGAIEKEKELVQQGIHIYSIAYGTEKGGPIPIKDPLGILRGYKKDGDNRTILTKVQGDFLKELAQKGGGNFYRSKLGGNHLLQLGEEINRLEKKALKSQAFTHYQELFQWFLLLGCLLALGELLIGDRRKLKREKVLPFHQTLHNSTNRTTHKPINRLINEAIKGSSHLINPFLILIPLVLGPAPTLTLNWIPIFSLELVFHPLLALAGDPSPPSRPPSSTPSPSEGLGTWYKNYKGVRNLRENNFFTAQDWFLEALKEIPLSGEIQLNLGLSFAGQGQEDKARQAYETALKISNSPLVGFIGNYNLGESYQREGNISKTLSYYQEALKWNPNSLEVKTNIELLFAEQQKQQQQQQQPKPPKKSSPQQQDQQQGQNQEGPQQDPSQKPQEKNQDQNSNPKNQNQDKNHPDKNQNQEDQKPRRYTPPQPQKFKSNELSQKDLERILQEIQQQDRRIRGEFDKKETKEAPLEKDW